VQTKVRQSQRPAETRCVFCHDDFLAEEELSCQCGALYHPDCFQFYGCGTIGCAGVVKTVAQIASAEASLQESYQRDVENYQRGVENYRLSIDDGIKRLRAVSWMWVIGALIISILAIIGSIFQGSLLQMALLCGGSLLSSAIGTIFHRKANKEVKAQETKAQEKDTI
jgi:hypothetical protein